MLTIVLGFCPAQNVSGINLADLVSPEQARTLLAGEKPVTVQFNNPAPVLSPKNEYMKLLIDEVRRDLDPSVMVETLYLYKKPYEAEKNALSAEEEAELFNSVLALSTLAGLQYYSVSRGAMRTFYETSIRIDGPSTKKLLPDPGYSRPPAELMIYARQKDLTFGDNIYQYNYHFTPGAIVFTQQNLSILTYGIIPAVGKNKLRSTVAILDAGDYLLVYAVSMAKAASLPGMKDRIGNSFANRAEAITKWFSDQADKAFKKVHS